LIENLSERKIKIPKSDNGGEYTSKEFVRLSRDVGIKREPTTPYNPQHNGLEERKNITIMEVVMTMIHDQDLPVVHLGSKHIIPYYPIVHLGSKLSKKCSPKRIQK
jgi:transposase InsO family protein